MPKGRFGFPTTVEKLNVDVVQGANVMVPLVGNNCTIGTVISVAITALNQTK